MTQLLDGLVGAIIGALVGGLATFWAGWWQTKRVLEHETKQAREAAEDERKAAREAWVLYGANDLLTALAQLDGVLPRVGAGRPTMRDDEEKKFAIDALRHAEVAIVPLMPAPIRTRWSHLRSLVLELDAARPNSDPEPDRADWTPQKVGRAREDVEAYMGYVQGSIVALLHGTDMPPEEQMPFLRRMDMAVWQPPAQRLSPDRT